MTTWEQIFEPKNVVSLGVQNLGDEMYLGFQYIDSKDVFTLSLGTGDALLLARNIHDAVEDMTTPK